MRLNKARVQNYRSVHDTGWFDVETDKTVLVGPNEAGKTAVFKALQTVCMPPGEKSELQPLRDYPRSRLTEISAGKVKVADAPVASAVFALDDADRLVLAAHAPHLAEARELGLYSFYDNNVKYNFGDVVLWGKYGDVEKPLAVLRGALGHAGEGAEAVLTALTELTKVWSAQLPLTGARGTSLDKWLDTIAPLLDLDDDKIDKAFDSVRAAARRDALSSAAYNAIKSKVPFFVYFSQYYKVRPRIHLGRLAAQEAADDIDDDYDFGNLCLLKLLGFKASELSEIGQDSQSAVLGRQPTIEEVKEYQDKRDARTYALNAASITLTNAISEVWGEQRALDIQADGQYLKVVVRNEDHAQVELDQGSEGFRWLVSFYVVFEAQARGEFANAILLLDEPGVSLHALKQKQFRETVSKIAKKNQTLFSTHSPFMVGSEEMDKVRIVEMKDRATGTKVHEDFAVDDPRSLFPLQAHFGYELGQTLFGQHRNLIVEGITDYWYLQALVEAARDSGHTTLEDKVTVLPAGDAGKVVYHATVLHSQGLRIAALLDSDTAGNTAASNETLVHLLKQKQILHVADFYNGNVTGPELEDLIRDTLLVVARDELGIDAVAQGVQQPSRALCDLLASEGGKAFSKYRLGKGFIRWKRTHGWDDLQPHEKTAVSALFTAANKGTKG